MKLTSQTVDRWDTASDSSLEIVQAKLGSSGLARHFHDTWSVGAVAYGQCHFNSGGMNHLASTGDIFVLPSFEVHACAALVNPMEYKVLYVSEETIALHVPTLLRAIIGSAQRVWSSPSMASKLFSLENNRQEALTWLDRFSKTAITTSNKSPRYEIQPLREILDRKWDQPVIFEEIETSTKCSRWHAIRLFTESVGMPPREYLRILRILRSRHLILRGESLADIAACLHFADQPHFSRNFKQVFGITPGCFRRLTGTSQALSADKNGDHRRQQQRAHQAIEPAHSVG